MSELQMPTQTPALSDSTLCNAAEGKAGTADVSQQSSAVNLSSHPAPSLVVANSDQSSDDMNLSLFAPLPLELQIKIWEFVAAYPRVRHALSSDIVIVVPPVLHVCRESRRVALLNFVLVLTTHPKPVYMNPKYDVLCLHNIEWELYELSLSLQEMLMSVQHISRSHPSSNDLHLGEETIFKRSEKVLLSLNNLFQRDALSGQDRARMVPGVWNNLRAYFPNFRHLLVDVPHGEQFSSSTSGPSITTLEGFVKQGADATYTEKQKRMMDILAASQKEQHEAGKDLEITFLKTA